MATSPVASELEFRGPMNSRAAEILTPDACRFLAGLFREFGPRREQILARRVERQKELDAGRLPDFLPETAGDPRGRLAGGAARGRISATGGRRSPARWTGRW